MAFESLVQMIDRLALYIYVLLENKDYSPGRTIHFGSTQYLTVMTEEKTGLFCVTENFSLVSSPCF